MEINVVLSNVTPINLMAGVFENKTCKMKSDDEFSISGTSIELIQEVNTASSESMPKNQGKSTNMYIN